MEKDDSLSPPSPPPSPPPILRRINSAVTSTTTTTIFLPPKLTLPSQNGTAVDHQNDVVSYELTSFKPSSPPTNSSISYTSLRDILPPPSLNSPTTAAASTPTHGSAYEISIRNRLVKQAAWAYLQPMSSSPDSTEHNLFRRVWLKFTSINPFTACAQFLTLHCFPCITKVFDQITRAVCIH